MKKKLTLAVVGLLALLGMSACSSSPVESGTDTSKDTRAYGGGDISEFEYQLRDGRTVTCIHVDGGYDGGTSCDWSNAK